MKRKNILFSTTRQWNPGDEFILFGVLNILREILAPKEFNPIIYNRHPEIIQPLSFYNPLRKIKDYKKGEWIWGSFLRVGHYDNSFKIYFTEKFIDWIIIAGSPGWFTLDSKPLYNYALKHEIPLIFLGIGSPNPDLKIPKITYKALKKSILRTVRDNSTKILLENLGFSAVLLPCPAFFASSFEKRINKVKKVGLVFSSYNSTINNRISKNTFKKLLELYSSLIKFINVSGLEVAFITHYIDELYDFKTNNYFKINIPIYYSYDAKEYIKIYNEFDVIVTFRLHGAILSASLGIPSIYLSHDYRGEAINLLKGIQKIKILTDTINFSEILKLFENLIDKIDEINIKLIQQKIFFKEKYKRLLKPILVEE